MAPREEVRNKAANVVGNERFLTVHLAAPIEVCRARDQEGLYGAADEGDVSPIFRVCLSRMKVPLQPDLLLETDQFSPAECVHALLQLLKERKFLT